jgi:ectoine hydroxylase-related dioxygenase (phytanoyl-CoA dioxygenase family)
VSTYSTYVAYRIDRWDANGYSVIEHVASAEDLTVARAAYEAACKRWPGEMITLRQGVRVLEDSRKTRLA